MAYIGPMILSRLLEEIHTLFSNGIDYPVAGDEDRNVRIALINSVIRSWQDYNNIKWRSLFDVRANQTIAAEGDVSLATDARFRRVSGRISLILASQTLKVPVFSQERLDDDDLPDTYAYISGAPGSYLVNLVGVPEQWIGATVRYRFYRYATQLNNDEDTPDMTNPNFIVFSVVAILFQLAHNNTGYTIYFNQAGTSLDGMTVANLENEIGEEERSIGGRIQNIGSGMGA